MGIKIVPILMILLAVLIRLIPHPANFAPITALALFGGVFLPKRYAFVLPIAALLVSDLFIGFYGLEMIFVYGSFLLSGLIGLWVRNHLGLLNLLGGTLLASVLFFLVTNFGVWIDPRSWYIKDFSGLMQSYYLGLPFFRNSLLGDLFFTAAFFGGYILVKNTLKSILPAKILNLLI